MILRLRPDRANLQWSKAVERLVRRLHRRSLSSLLVVVGRILKLQKDESHHAIGSTRKCVALAVGEGREDRAERGQDAPGFVQFPIAALDRLSGRALLGIPSDSGPLVSPRRPADLPRNDPRRASTARRNCTEGRGFDTTRRVWRASHSGMLPRYQWNEQPFPAPQLFPDNGIEGVDLTIKT